jgi:signal transduction histidine kinase/ActR/RegA family two-component response regulator
MLSIIKNKMSPAGDSTLNSMVLVGIGIATAYLALDTILHVFFSDRFNVIAQMIGPDLYEIYIRIIILCLFVFFGSHAQFTINNLKEAEEELKEYRDHLEELVKERTAELEESNQKLTAEVKERKRSERQISRDLSIDLDQTPFLEYIHPEDKQRVIEWYKKRLKGNNVPNSHTFKLVNRNDKEIWVELNAALINWENRVAALNFLRDVTAQKKLETQFLQSQRMESIGTLAGGIAHDFNNLLMGIQGNVSVMLLDLDHGNPFHENVKSIERCVRSGARLTKQLLGFARGGKYVVKPTSLNDVINRTAHIFGRTRKQINIHRENLGNIWLVNADVAQIEQVMLNLYVNAWQAMPDGGDLYLGTENVMLDDEYIETKPFHVEPGSYVKFSVTDTGIGMDKETQQRIFEPFFTTKEVGTGSGLGLASTYGIVKNHGGFINCYSEPEHGTTFSIYLPANTEATAEEKEPVEVALEGSETILLVDDEEVIVKMGARMLEGLGYKVLQAKSGNEALTIYGRSHDLIDVIILDLIMPHMHGGQVFDRMRKINPQAKVLLSSGYSLKGQAEKIIKRGCDGFIQKPFDTVRLSKKIREILEQTPKS